MPIFIFTVSIRAAPGREPEVRRIALLVLLALSAASARPVAIGGVVTSPRVETKTLPSGAEGLPVWFLARLGVATVNQQGEVRLALRGRELRFSAAGWTDNGQKVSGLSAPEMLNGSVHVSLAVLRVLGVPLLSDAPEALDFAVPSTVQAGPAALSPGAVNPGLVNPGLVNAAPAMTAPATPGSPAATGSAPAVPAVTVPTTATVRAATPPVPVLPTVPPLSPAAPVRVNPAPLPAAPALPGAAPSGAGAPVALPAAPAAQLTLVRSSRTLKRAQETQRVVLEFSSGAPYQLAQDKRGVTLTFAAMGAESELLARSGLVPVVPALSAPVVPTTVVPTTPVTPGIGSPAAVPALPVASPAPLGQKLESGDTLTVTRGQAQLTVRLETGEGGASKVFTLENPFRVVIDTVTNLDPSVTPPPDLEALPPGAAYRQIGKLQLLSFDPSHFTPKVVTAGIGSSASVFDLVKRVGGVAGVNGGYFDPKTSFPVDLVAQGGLMVSASLERRATLGFTDDGVLFGFPRPRYTLTGQWGTLTVNTVRPQPHPNWVTLFVGDGRTSIGAPGFTTLLLDGASVTRALSGPHTPGAGQISVTFDPARFPQLPQSAGAAVQLALNWAAPGWDGVREALSAGPLLVEGGQYALDALREGFDVKTSVWRPTRQVAFAMYAGKPTIAYFDNGTPEEFARALVSVGASRALRLDSGSSATVYVAGGYFNTVWSRPVPNAIVFVPRTGEAALGR